jgi:hypothetical protein
MCQGRTLVLMGVLLFLLMGAYLLVVSGGRVPVALVPPLVSKSAAAGPAVRVSSSSASGSLEVLGSPSISAAFIERVFEAYQSPAAGSGQVLYDLGVQYGIDPVYALAFFWHESTLGRAGWGAVNHSLGNIRCSSGYACQGGFRSYATWAEGFLDWYRLIRLTYVNQWGLRTVEQIVPVYAPSGDHNDVEGYIAAIEEAVRVWRSGAVLVP